MAVPTEQYSALRQRLEEERETLSRQVEDLRQEMIQFTQDIGEEDSSYGNHMADDATNTFEQERRGAEQRNLETVLQQVEDALGRMDEGAYGRCIDCGREIPIERLEARPYALRCIEDQAREDARR
jgi:RNA polymerase-binding protein DksA